MNHIPPLLSLCMIVRNEQARLPAAIQSVSTIVDEIIIVDTGSTDQTIQLAENYASLVMQVNWNDDFSEVRNLSLEEATGEWILIMDADETLHPEDLSKVRKLIHTGEQEGYFITMINRIGQSIGFQEEHFPAIRLFRNHPSYRFSGAIHEQICSIPTDKITLSGIRILHHGNEDDRSKRANRSVRNIRILKNEVEQNPDDAFSRYNLGVEYTVAGRYQQSIDQFEQAKVLLSGKPLWASRFYKSLAYCYIKVEQWEMAAQTIAEGIAHFPDYSDLFYLQGMLLTAQKKFHAALLPFYTCLALGDAIDSQHLAEKGMGTDKAHFALGSVYEALGETKKARLCYHNAFHWNWAHIEAGKRWVKLLLSEMPIQASVHCLEAVLHRSNPDHLLIMANILAEVNEYSRSRRTADKALRQGAEINEVLFVKALCDYKKVGIEKAKRFIGQIEDKSAYRKVLGRFIHYSFKEINNIGFEGAEKFPLSSKLIQCRNHAQYLLQVHEIADDSVLTT